MTIHRTYFPDSTMLQECEYNTDSKELSVTFKNGKTYVYASCPYNTYEDLINARSSGAYFNSIKASLNQKEGTNNG